MKGVIIVILFIIILYLLYSVCAIENFQASKFMSLFNIKSYIEKTGCSPYKKHTVNCYKKLLDGYKKRFNTKILEIYSDMLVKKELNKIDVKSPKCYETLNKFPSNIVGNIIDLTKNISDAGDKIRFAISNQKYYKEEDVGFIQVYRIIQQNVKKYNKDKLVMIEIPEIEDNYIKDKDTCEIPSGLKTNDDIDSYTRENISKHMVYKLKTIMDMIDINMDDSIIKMYDVDKLEQTLKGAVVEFDEDIEQTVLEMRTISERMMVSLGVVSKTINKYYCSNYVDCCHQEDCEQIRGLIKQSKFEKKKNYKRMVELYEKKYRKCLDKTKNKKRQTYVKQSNLCKKIDLK